MAAGDRDERRGARARRPPLGRVRHRDGSRSTERADPAEFAAPVTTLTAAPPRSLNSTQRPMEPNHQPHVPGPSLWPVGFAIGVVVLLIGIVVGWPIVVLGAILAV